MEVHHHSYRTEKIHSLSLGVSHVVPCRVLWIFGREPKRTLCRASAGARQYAILLYADIKEDTWARDGGRCVKCGSQENLEFDPYNSHFKGRCKNLSEFADIVSKLRKIEQHRVTPRINAGK